MSLARTALRLATLEALRPTAALATGGPWPTIAGKAVFDSRLDPIEDLAPGEERPVVCVYTDDDEGTSGQKAGGPPFKQVVDLVFEISVIARAPAAADPSQYDVGVPETDAELEASLDLLETQIKCVLFYHPSGKIWRGVTKRKVRDPRSLPHRSSEEGVRLARRRVIWKTEVLDDCFDPSPATAPAGLARLPQPLQAVLAALAATAYGAQIGQGLALEPSAPVMPTATPLRTVTLGEKVADPSGHVPASPNVQAEVDGLS